MTIYLYTKKRKLIYNVYEHFSNMSWACCEKYAFEKIVSIGLFWTWRNLKAWHWAANQWCCCSWHDLLRMTREPQLRMDWMVNGIKQSENCSCMCVVYLQDHTLKTQVLKLGRLQYVCVILFWCFNILHLILHLSILIPRHQWVPIWIPSLSHSTGGTFHQSKAALHENGLPKSGIGNGKMIKYICSVDGRNPAPNWYVVFPTVYTKVLYIPGGCLGCLFHQPYPLSVTSGRQTMNTHWGAILEDCDLDSGPSRACQPPDDATKSIRRMTSYHIHTWLHPWWMREGIPHYNHETFPFPY